MLEKTVSINFLEVSAKGPFQDNELEQNVTF